MQKQTLLFQSITDMAFFSKQLPGGYLLNTNNCTITGKFSEEEIQKAISNFGARLIKTTEKVFSYESLV
jgi:hypothetical protein